MTRRPSGPWTIIVEGRSVGIFRTRDEAREFQRDILMGEGYIAKA